MAKTMIHHGVYFWGKKRVSCRSTHCTTCGKPRLFEGLRSLMVWHLFLIPILPLGTTVRYYCTQCHCRLDSGRPSSPVVLVLGALAGIVISLVGVMIFLDGQEQGAAMGCIAFGLAMTGFMIWIMKRENYAAFDAARKSAEPLRGDSCPLCHSALFASTKPHCHSCRVDIITK